MDFVASNLLSIGIMKNIPLYCSQDFLNPQCHGRLSQAGKALDPFVFYAVNPE
jgi:hypothetical protein